MFRDGCTSFGVQPSQIRGDQPVSEFKSCWVSGTKAEMKYFAILLTLVLCPYHLINSDMTCTTASTSIQLPCVSSFAEDRPNSRNPLIFAPEPWKSWSNA